MARESVSKINDAKDAPSAQFTSCKGTVRRQPDFFLEDTSIQSSVCCPYAMKDNIVEQIPRKKHLKSLVRAGPFRCFTRVVQVFGQQAKL